MTRPDQRQRQPPLCALRGVSVRCPDGRLALDTASLALHPGEVVALLGENGAGKSTLLHSLYGMTTPCAGEICYGGAQVTASPERAIAGGIGLVHQHFMLVPRLTVAENVVLGREPRRLGLLVDRRRAEAVTAELAARYGLAVDPRRRVDELSVGEAQRVEIIKTLYRGARALLLDEPTAVLTPGEAQQLLGVLRDLLAQDRGRGLLIVTHKLDEVLQVADRAIVLRRGHIVAEYARAEFDARELAHAMVGRTLVPIVRAPGAVHQETAQETAGPAPLRVSGLRVERDGVERVRGVSLTVPAGTILGIAGVEGNGQSELCAAICGLLPARAGSVEVGGEDLTGASVQARRRRGLSLLPEDRHKHGLVLDFTLAENLLLGDEAHYAPGPLGLIDQRRLHREAGRLLADADVRPPDPDAAARVLSGGNQQKVVLLRALGGTPGRAGHPPRNKNDDVPANTDATDAPLPRVLIAAQPTRGVDIGAIQAIHRALLDARDRGCAILLVSAELDELRVLCDRIAVMRRGELHPPIENPPEAPLSREHLGELLTGAA